MIAFNLMCVVAVVVVVASPTTWGRSVEPEASPLLSFRGSPAKRALFDPACAGIYNRELLGRLDRVCDDCYNVYRDPKVSTECRSNCFLNPSFVQCLEYLIPEELHEEYQAHVQMVGK